MKAPRFLPPFIVLVAVVGVSLLLVLSGCSESQQHSQAEAAPDFSLATSDGKRIQLSDLRGEVVILDFWATWCPPCRAAIPHMVELQGRYRNEGLQVLGMNMDKDNQELADFMNSQTISYPVLRVSEEVRLAYGGIPSIPVAYLIDHKGIIRKKFLGYDHRIAMEMEQAVQELLHERQASQP